MIELIKKSMLMRLGLAFVNKEKVEELASEFIEKGKMSGTESKEFFEELMKKSEDSSKKVEDQITAIVNDTLKKLNFATQEDISEIKQQLAELKLSLEKSGEST